MSTDRIIKIGTRKSRLAIAQSSVVQRALMAAHPGLKVELVGIEASADETAETPYSDVPLWQLEGKNFFVKELDEALLDGRTDCSIHSYKDLSVERPEGLTLAAIPKRENPRDIALFRGDILEKLSAGKPLRIGTSAPRRMYNTPRFLKQALPQFGTEPHLEICPIRGNVDSRLKRLWMDESEEKAVDGVILALAGLSRLYDDEEQQAGLQELLSGLRIMVLPVTHCPAAPGQGALAIECRADDTELIGLLKTLHDPATERHVQREREILVQYGGGCHQAFGATSLSVEHFPNHLLYIAGQTEDGRGLDDVQWDQPDIKGERPIQAWDGTEQRAKQDDVNQLGVEPAKVVADAVFVSHARAVADNFAGVLAKRRVWTSGAASWFKMAKQGIWVEGCGEGLGIEFLKTFLGLPILGLPNFSDWQVLTHTLAVADWAKHQAIATYTVEDVFDEESAEALKTATHVYWSSASQYDLYKDYVSAHAHHACGAGKTAERLRQLKLPSLTIFPNHEEWKKCLM